MAAPSRVGHNSLSWMTSQCDLAWWQILRFNLWQRGFQVLFVSALLEVVITYRKNPVLVLLQITHFFQCLGIWRLTTIRRRKIPLGAERNTLSIVLGSCLSDTEGGSNEYAFQLTERVAIICHLCYHSPPKPFIERRPWKWTGYSKGNTRKEKMESENLHH